MTYSHQRYNDLVAATFQQVRELGDLKGREYAHGGDRLDNFRRHAQAMDVPMELIWYVYANKHWDAVTQYVRDGMNRETPMRPNLETIESRLDDIITYCLLMKAIVDERMNPKRVTSDDLACSSTIAPEMQDRDRRYDKDGYCDNPTRGY